MKGREVYDLLKNDLSSQPNLLKVLVKQAEDLHAIQKTIPEMAKSFDALANMLSQHTMILGGMKDRIDTFKKRFNDVRSLGETEG